MHKKFVLYTSDLHFYENEKKEEEEEKVHDL